MTYVWYAAKQAVGRSGLRQGQIEGSDERSVHGESQRCKRRRLPMCTPAAITCMYAQAGIRHDVLEESTMPAMSTSWAVFGKQVGVQQ